MDFVTLRLSQTVSTFTVSLSYDKLLAPGERDRFSHLTLGNKADKHIFPKMLSYPFNQDDPNFSDVKFYLNTCSCVRALSNEVAGEYMSVLILYSKITFLRLCMKL